MKRSRKKNPSSSINLLMKSLTLASEILLMIRKLLVIDVCKHSFHKKSLLELESAEMPLKKFGMQLLLWATDHEYTFQKLKLLCFAAVCEILYGHQCLLNPPPLATIPEEPEIGEPFNKKRRAADDYIRYKNALPDVKPINE